MTWYWLGVLLGVLLGIDIGWLLTITGFMPFLTAPATEKDGGDLKRRKEQ